MKLSYDEMLANLLFKFHLESDDVGKAKVAIAYFAALAQQAQPEQSFQEQVEEKCDACGKRHIILIPMDGACVPMQPEMPTRIAMLRDMDAGRWSQKEADAWNLALDAVLALFAPKET